MKLKTILITGRTIDQGATIEAKTSQNYFMATAYCELNSSNIDALGISEGENIKVETKYGKAVVPVKVNNGNPDNIAFIPMGPWANAVIDPNTGGCGMPQYKGVEAEIEPTNENVLNIKELIQRYKV